MILTRRSLALLAAGAVAAPGARAQSGRLVGREVRIGAVVPSSGPFAEWGRSNTATLRMIEEQVNAAGGVEGAKLRLFVYDDAARPAQAANLVRKLAEDDKVLGIAGPLTSSACEVAFPVANQARVPCISQASSKPGVAAANRPWAFRNTIDEAVLMRTALPFLKEAYRVAKVAIIYDAKDANSVALGSRIMPELLGQGGIALANAGGLASFNTGDIDVSAQVTALKALDPDAVVCAADYSQAITVLREMRRQGLTKPVIGGTPLISSAILRAVPELPIVSCATYYAGQPGEAARRFTEALTPILRRTSGLPATIEPSMYDANIQEILGIFLDAVRKQGLTLAEADLATDRERIRAHLEHLTGFDGLSGPIHFNPDGDAVKTFLVVVGQNGAWTEKLRGCSTAGALTC
ncbi:ABC transporter substrate-binding protein [Paracraurococcus lichenis]|uniref:ABC transporter substrate-binding protein n=1 Tax=Paracraurococcus lichenis TaxID=3064888 RepID=A0ABT9E913_9PROT|nr:ABC transporter substrate-binding protein [Paracraurococcus sp. LOR1-02]MDO9712668.1 ABC transporter substrate-binding protein [Paracraurococcus sp. LOR1-02]